MGKELLLQIDTVVVCFGKNYFVWCYIGFPNYGAWNQPNLLGCGGVYKKNYFIVAML